MGSLFSVLRAILDWGAVGGNSQGRKGRVRTCFFVMEGSVVVLGVGSVEGNGCRWGDIRCKGVATC